MSIKEMETAWAQAMLARHFKGPVLEVIEALLNGAKVWEIPQSRFQGDRKGRKWEVSEDEMRFQRE